MTTQTTKPKSNRIGIRLLGLLLIAYGALAGFNNEWVRAVPIVFGLFFLIAGKGIL